MYEDGKHASHSGALAFQPCISKAGGAALQNCYDDVIQIGLPQSSSTDQAAGARLGASKTPGNLHSLTDWFLYDLETTHKMAASLRDHTLHQHKHEGKVYKL